MNDQITHPLENLATRLQDGLTCFLDNVARPKDPPQVQGANAILCALASSLSRLFLHDSLLLIWKQDGCIFAAGCLSQEGAQPHPLDQAQTEIEDIQQGPQLEQTCSPLHITWFGQAPEVRALCITTEGSVREEQLWVVCQTQGTRSAEWAWFPTYLLGLKSLYVSVHAILRAQSAISAHRTALYAQVKRLIHHPSPDGLMDAISLLEQGACGDASDADLLQDVAIFLLQQILGTGWKVHGPEEIYPAAIDLCRRLLECPGGKDLDPLRCVLGCLQVLRDPRGCLDIAPMGEAVFDLLPLWTQVHEVWRPLYTSPLPAPTVAQDLWREAVERTLPRLFRYLADLDERIRADEAGLKEARSLPSVRNLLYLWFCLQLLRADHDASQTGWVFDAERNLLRADLAYVLRESLRFICFGSRPDYFFHTPTYAEALQTLITRHAHDVVGLPEGCAIHELLTLIANEGGINGLFAAEHLQHVLEIYMMGHFLLSLRLQAAEAGPDRRHFHGWTLAQALAAPDQRCPDNDTVRKYLQAFSLAALFHDIDHLFLGREPTPGVAHALRDAELQQTLTKLCEVRRQAAVELAGSWIAELLQAGYIAEKDDSLQTWKNEQGQWIPRHGLLSAWYLHRICVKQKDGFKETLRMAVRAVLLHNALSAPIDAGRDPLAALLVLCDEVFEWDPSQQTAPSDIGRSLHMMGTSVSAHEPRDRFIRIEGMYLKEEGSEAYLDLPKEEGALWPVIELTLQIPERLDVPVYLLWLRKSRNLGRLRRASSGLGPTVKVKSSVAITLQRLKLTNAALLHLLVHQVSPNFREVLRKWVMEVPMSTSTDRKEETVSIGPLQHTGLCEANFKELRLELEEATEKLLREQKDPGEVKLPEPGPTSTNGGEHGPSLARLRHLLKQVLVDDADLNAFCLDYFRNVYEHFTDGMDRVTKVNLLLRRAPPSEILARLEERQRV